MTDEEINIAIAEACGLFRLKPLRRTTRKGIPSPDGVRLWYCESHHGGAATYVELPDYVNDLNAMHEAEKELIKQNLYQDYWPTLESITGSSKLAHATAKQKAKAFIRTLNLQKESK